MKAMVEEFKVNNKVYLNIQIIAEEKVKAFLGENAMSLLKFALAAVTEALRQDSQKQLLVEKTPPIQNYDLNSTSVELEQPPFPYDDYPYTAKEKVLKEASKFYNMLFRGLTARYHFHSCRNTRGRFSSSSLPF